MAIYDFNGNIIPIEGANTPHLSVPWVSSMHRGYSSPTVRENTLEAFYRAYLNGADWIEVDARLTKDGVYVCSHDGTVTVNGTTYTIADETAETLTSLVLSVDPIYGDCHIPPLESVLKLCAYTGLFANIDCKSISTESFAKLVVDSGMSGRSSYANLAPAGAAEILAIDPNAGFIFPYSAEKVTTWKNALPDYHTRQRSFAWSPFISYEALEDTRSKGFKFLLSSISESNYMSKMPYNPDMIEFESTADCKALNESYLNGLDFGI